jgi:hypothetical protein
MHRYNNQWVAFKSFNDFTVIAANKNIKKVFEKMDENSVIFYVTNLPFV